MQQELKKDFEMRVPNRDPHQGFSIGIDHYKRVCSPDADVMTVWYRLSQLELLRQLSEAGGTSLPWLQEPGDAVFKVLATVPMTQGGQGPPVDVKELIKLIEKESEA
jgi:hypothetical protein